MIKPLLSILFQEGIFNYIKRKRNISFLDNRKIFTIKYNGRDTKIFLNKKFGFVDMYIFDHGIYEKHIVDDLRTYLGPDKVMLDIGANIGQHSLLLAPYCNEIYAFEPVPDVYTEFKNSIEANRFKNIHLYNTAIGSETATASFNYVAGHAGISSFVSSKNPGKTEITVQIEPLHKMMGDVKFDVIKLDVEGYEAVVVLGNKDIILKNRPVIFMEWCASCIEEEGTHKPKELSDFFFDNNFEIYSRKLNRNLKKDDTDFFIGDDWVITPKN